MPLVLLVSTFVKLSEWAPFKSNQVISIVLGRHPGRCQRGPGMPTRLTIFQLARTRSVECTVSVHTRIYGRKLLAICKASNPSLLSIGRSEGKCLHRNKQNLNVNL